MRLAAAVGRRASEALRTGRGRARRLASPADPARRPRARALAAGLGRGGLRGPARHPQGRSRTRCPAAYRPDLVVIGLRRRRGRSFGRRLAAGPAAAAAGPRAVVLIETLRAVDRLRAGAAGVDAVFQVDRMAEHLPRYAPRPHPGRRAARHGAPGRGRRRARGGASPSTSAEAHIRVVRTPARAARCRSCSTARCPICCCSSARLADGDGLAVARMVRQDRRFAHLPIVFLGSDDVAERIERFGPGGDDFLAHPVDPRSCSRPSSPGPSGAAGSARRCTATC